MSKINSPKRSTSSQSIDSHARGLDWRGLVGLDSAMRDLSAMLESDRFHPVLMLEGREGLGKRHLAYWMAAKILCASPHEGQPCCHCVDCVEILSGQHADLMVFDAGDDSLKTADIERLQEHIDILTSSGKRIALVMNAEKMTKEAANRALKTFEEPPAQARIILTTSRPLMLPKTILGRCLRWKVKPLNRAVVVQWLCSKSRDHVEHKGERAQHFDLSQAELIAMRWGYSPGQIVRHVLSPEAVNAELVEAAVRNLLMTSSSREVLRAASDLAKIHKVKIAELLRMIEWSLSDSLRRRVHEQGSLAATMVSSAESVKQWRRRKLLREVRAKAIFGKIALNAQLVAESIGFSQWDEGEI